jgi:hypothetical protein
MTTYNIIQLTVVKSYTLESDKSSKWRVYAATDALPHLLHAVLI